MGRLHEHLLFLLQLLLVHLVLHLSLEGVYLDGGVGSGVGVFLVVESAGVTLEGGLFFQLVIQVLLDTLQVVLLLYLAQQSLLFLLLSLLLLLLLVLLQHGLELVLVLIQLLHRGVVDLIGHRVLLHSRLFLLDLAVLLHVWLGSGCLLEEGGSREGQVGTGHLLHCGVDRTAVHRPVVGHVVPHVGEHRLGTLPHEDLFAHEGSDVLLGDPHPSGVLVA